MDAARSLLNRRRPMQILIADDDAISRRLATHALSGCGADVSVAEDGHAAWAQIQARRQSTVLVLDREMPGIDGLDLCRRARLLPSFPPLYIVMVTSAAETVDITAGLDAGADDYVIKPFNAAELRARAQVGMRMAALQESMARRLSELEQALTNVKQLRGLLPMCAYCKKIRVDNKYWQQLEGYLSDHSDAEFSHGICPECFPSVIDGIQNEMT
jgi:sigma-B regulation protein RsbU (phosphoserine phosphatase)